MQPSNSRGSVSSQKSARPRSSASTRPSSSASTRPSSSASLRPSSSASVRPSSSGSSIRPSPSTTSSHPGSRLTQRPSSRYTQRPSTRQSSRLLSLCQTLVTQVAGLTAESDPENFRVTLDYVSRSTDQTVNPSGSMDMGNMEKQLRGHAQKARIHSHDALANALEASTRRLNNLLHEASDLDSDIKTSRLPSHLQLLLLLSSLPERRTFEFADRYIENIRNPPKSPPALTWKDILAEEPFEGQHWEGAYGLPSHSTVENWESQNDESSPSLSPLDDLDDLEDSVSSFDSDGRPETPPVAHEVADITNRPPVENGPVFSHREEVENLRSRQYWRPEWRTDALLNRPFNMGDASTLGPAYRRALYPTPAAKLLGLVQEKYIHEHDAVREVLMGLQGRRNLMLSWMNLDDKPYTFVPSSDAPGLVCLTLTAQYSILESFAQTATILEHLRKFVSAVFAKASQLPAYNGTPSHLALKYRNIRTLEALCEAVDLELRRFDQWCAGKEEAMCIAQAGIGSPDVFSLLSLEKAIQDHFSSTFAVLADILREVVQRATRSSEQLTDIWTLPDLPTRVTPAMLTAMLLDLQLHKMEDYATMGDHVTSEALMRVFIHTAEPIWTMIGRWLKDGMPVSEATGPREHAKFIGVDEEFFIENNDLPLLSPDFWSDGFTLRDSPADDEARLTAVPIFLKHAAGHILRAGRAIGLLRVLEMPSVFEREGEQPWMAVWPSFGKFVNNTSISIMTLTMADDNLPVFKLSVDDVSRLVYDELLLPCTLAQRMLTRVLVEDCDLWLHLFAMEDLYLMRRGDAISHFIDVLFSRMDGPLPWGDFHFLNSAFRDVANAGSTRWIDSSLVRLSHRGSRDKTINRTVRAIEGLLIEYAVPFPLTYIFGPRAMQVYSSIFAFVLQIRRAKSALERILVRSALANTPHLGGELKVFYAMRSKLSWFVNALLNFVSTNVIHTQILAFHTALKEAQSLDEMIVLHEEHLGKLEGRCLLHRNTSALHRSILAILDMALYFSDCFVAFAGDSTHDISRQSLLLMKRHRSRRQRRQRRNVIGFSQNVQEPDESSESESDEDAETKLDTAFEPSFSLATSSISFADESFVVRLDKMSTELDTLVRFIRRGVESLAGEPGEAAPAFGIFAFALEDWDL